MSRQRREDRSLESRDLEAREMEYRDVEAHEVYNNEAHDPLYIPKHLIPSGVRYRWIRESIYDKPDDSRYSMMRRVGWNPVPSSRHPELMFQKEYERRPCFNGFIFHGGLVLCERSEELCKQDDIRRREQDMKTLKGLPGYESLQVDAGIPITGKNEVYMTREGGQQFMDG